jgi:hypothetical protein
VFLVIQGNEALVDSRVTDAHFASNPNGGVAFTFLFARQIAFRNHGKLHAVSHVHLKTEKHERLLRLASS